MMVSRHWTGLAKTDRAGEYILHLQLDTFKKIAKIKGFRSSHILKRDLEEGIEFLVITEWDSIEAVKEFAGENYETAVVPPIVQEIMIRYDEKVKHYEVNYRSVDSF